MAVSKGIELGTVTRCSPKGLILLDYREPKLEHRKLQYKRDVRSVCTKNHSPYLKSISLKRLPLFKRYLILRLYFSAHRYLLLANSNPGNAQVP